MRDDVATFDEQFAVKRDANGSTGGLAAVDRRHRPALHALDLGDFACRHHHDLIAGGEMTGLDAPRQNAAVVELVDRLDRQSQRELLQRPGRFERVERLYHGGSMVPGYAWRALGDVVYDASGNRNHGRWCY